jgi:exonuclease III
MNKKNLQIIQWNPNGFYSKIDEIKLIINRFSPVALCIQKTNNFTNNKSGSLKNYTTFFQNRTSPIRASGGVATFIDTQYPSEEITLVTNLEAVAVRISFKYKLTICNMYIPNPQILYTSKTLSTNYLLLL